MQNTETQAGTPPSTGKLAPLREALNSRGGMIALLSVFVLIAASAWRDLGTEIYVRDEGEMLFHSALSSGKAAFHMPVKTLFTSLFFLHSGAWMQMTLSLAYALLSGWLMYALASSIAGPLAGLLAAALSAGGQASEPLFHLSILLMAACMVMRQKRNSAAVNAALGLSIGMSLLCRSVFCAFPLLLAAADITGAPSGEKRRTFLARTLPMLGLAYGLLIPWIYFNWKMNDTFSPFELHGADLNIVAGALGTTGTVEGDIKGIVGMHVSTYVKGWAVSYVLHHPLNYLMALCRRLAFIVQLYPLLFAAAGAGLIYLRKNRAYLALASMAGYFIGIHIIMAVEARYFEGLYPLLAVIAAAAAASLIAGNTERKQSSTLAAAGAAALVPMVAFTGYTAFKLFAATAPHKGTTISRTRLELAKYPNDIWLHNQIALHEFTQGNYKAALAYSKPIALMQARPLQLEMAVFMAHPEADLKEVSDPIIPILSAAYKGDVSGTALHLQEYYNSELRWHAMVRTDSSETDRLVGDALRTQAADYLTGLFSDLDMLPRPMKEKIVATVDTACRTNDLSIPGICLGKAGTPLHIWLADSGYGDNALKYVRLYEPVATLDQFSRARFLQTLGNMGRPKEALSALAPLLRENDADALTTASNLACAMKNRAEAANYAARAAGAIMPSPWAPPALLPVYEQEAFTRRLKQKASACGKMYEETAISLQPGFAGNPPDTKTAAGELALLAGDTQSAFLLAGKADKACASPGCLQGLIRIYMGAGRTREAELVRASYFARLAKAPKANSAILGAARRACFAAGEEETEPMRAALAPKESSLYELAKNIQTAMLSQESLRAGAIRAQTLRDYPKMIDYFNRMVAARPNDASVLSDRGVGYAIMGNMQKAGEDFRAALDKDPSFLQASASLGYVLEMEGRKAEAAEVYRKAIAQPACEDQRELCAQLSNSLKYLK